jgi:glyoxylase-like metal-dependent hydrolase (beta-lactamase superfamily II)
VRTLRVHGDALVVTSALWQVNAIAVRAGGTTTLVDGVVLPEEVDALPATLGDAGFAPDALVATHAHFDHLLAPMAFGDLPLRAGATTLALLRDDPGAPARDLREGDAELYLERGRPLALDRLEPLGDLPFEVVEADGHAADGIALFAPGPKLLLPGDYLIAIEIPLLAQAGSPERYLATLDRLAPLVDRADVVVPGHGPPLDRARARALLDLDRRYVADLAAGPLRGPADHRQRRIHEDNVRKHAHAG